MCCTTSRVVGSVTSDFCSRGLLRLDGKALLMSTVRYVVATLRTVFSRMVCSSVLVGCSTLQTNKDRLTIEYKIHRLRSTLIPVAARYGWHLTHHKH